MNKKILIAVGIILVGLVFAGKPYAIRWIEEDSCLDKGGRISGEFCEFENGKVPLNCCGEACIVH